MAFRITIHRKITWLLLFSILSLAIASRLIYISERNIEQTNFGISQTYEAIVTIQQMLNSVTSPGSEPAMNNYLDSLQSLVRDNTDQVQQITRLRTYFRNPSMDSRQEAKQFLSVMMQEESLW